jgi:hypothetical protein
MTSSPDPALRHVADLTTAVRFLVPVVPEVPALLDAARGVLAACAAAEDDRTERALWIARAADAWTVPVGAVVGSGLPAPLAGRVAWQALSRLAAVVEPAYREGPDHWTGPDGRPLTAFRPVSADPDDLALLERAAARLTSARRRREGALAAALAVLGDDEDRHPAALGCLLAVLVPVADRATMALHRAARVPHRPLDAEARDAHRAVRARVLDRLAAAR